MNAQIENTEVEVVVQTLDEVLSALGTKSAKIRHLSSIGWKRGAIAKYLGIRYQHVRNVLITPLKKND